MVVGHFCLSCHPTHRVQMCVNRRVYMCDLILKEKAPATRFADAHLLGNGRLGASVFGTVPDERILINDDTFWSGSESRHENPLAREKFGEARELVFQRKYREAADLIEGKMLGTWNQSYQPVGRLQISMSSGDVETSDHLWRRQGIDCDNYTRCLDLRNALERIDYDFRGQHVTQECFVSNPSQLILVRLSAASKELNFCLSFESEIRFDVAVDSGGLRITGRAPDHVEPNYSQQKPSVMYLPDSESNSIRFAALVEVLDTDGDIRADRQRLCVSGASTAVIAVAVRTNYSGYKQSRDKNTAPLLKRCRSDIDAAADKSYENLKADHIVDYKSLFDRVSLEIEPSVTSNLPTSERMELQTGKVEDPSLLALALQYSRYLLISSSRPGTQAANLQGIWNPLVRPPWSSNYTTNINVQMNYWPAESLNLSECHGPMLDLIEEIADSGKWTAEEYYGLGGWACNHNSDLWRSTIPVGGLASWAYWPVAGGWLCQHLWNHYAYTGDRDFLENRAYPIMMGSAKFLLEFLVEDDEGYLSTAPSISPENNFFINDIEDIDEKVFLGVSARNRMVDKRNATTPVCKSSTMDMTIIRELFEHCLLSADILDKNDDLLAGMEKALEKLYPFKIGRHGQLQEWNEDFAECTPGMGHVSHMYGLYPGDMFSRTRKPELYEACRKSMMRRLNHGGHRSHWPGAWAMSLFARLKESFICGSIAESVFADLGANMMTAGSFQLDCIFGIGAGVAEMLVQGHNGFIELLPALPPSWASGRFTGFRLRDGFEVSCVWKDRKIVSADITSLMGGPCRIEASGANGISLEGKELSATQAEANVIEFDSEPGKTYSLLF